MILFTCSGLWGNSCVFCLACLRWWIPCYLSGFSQVLPRHSVLSFLCHHGMRINDFPKWHHNFSGLVLQLGRPAPPHRKINREPHAKGQLSWSTFCEKQTCSFCCFLERARRETAISGSFMPNVQQLILRLTFGDALKYCSDQFCIPFEAKWIASLFMFLSWFLVSLRPRCANNDAPKRNVIRTRRQLNWKLWTSCCTYWSDVCPYFPPCSFQIIPCDPWNMPLQKCNSALQRLSDTISSAIHFLTVISDWMRNKQGINCIAWCCKAWCILCFKTRRRNFEYS